MATQYKCPCCGFRTLSEKPPGTFGICPVCLWEDDNAQYEDPNLEGGANRPSLTQAIKNFKEFGASDLQLKSKVRPPTAEEKEP
jgi:hypothetical protein